MTHVTLLTVVSKYCSTTAVLVLPASDLAQTRLKPQIVALQPQIVAIQDSNPRLWQISSDWFTCKFQSWKRSDTNLLSRTRHLRFRRTLFIDNGDASDVKPMIHTSSFFGRPMQSIKIVGLYFYSKTNQNDWRSM